MTSSLSALTRRIEALEARLADVEGGYSRTLYNLERRSIRADLILSEIVTRFDLMNPSEEDIDAVLDER